MSDTSIRFTVGVARYPHPTGAQDTPNPELAAYVANPTAFTFTSLAGSLAALGSSALQAEQWYHVVVSYDGSGAAADGIKIFVDGEVDAPGAADDLRVAFTECSFRLRPRGGGGGSAREGALRVPLPRPVGSLRTTHCDEELRVSRGGRGGVFVLRRLKNE